MVITEEDLRQAWQNGRGRLPAFPPDTRFTPAALDFLKVCQPAAAMAVLYPAPPAPAPAPAADRRELQAPPGQRRIYTAAEVPELLAGGGTTLVVHASVTITHAAMELLRKAGVRVIPFVEQKLPLPEPFRPAPPLNPARMAAPAAAPAAPAPARVDEAALARIKEAVQSRLGRPVDAALLDSVVRKVLAAL
jgi:hypothetical protein